MWLKRNLSPLLQIAVLLTAMAAMLSTVISTWIPRPPPTGHTAAFRTELGNEHAAESILTHGVGPNGQAWTKITYRTGDRGHATYRVDGTIMEFKVTFPDGAPRLRAVFDWQGKYVIDGMELRADGSKVWTAEKLPDGKLKTVSYWKNDGKVFSEVVRDLQASTVESTFYRSIGGLWAHQLTDGVDADGNPQLVAEEVYHENGKPARVRKSPRGTTVGTMTYYRYDGTLDYVQHFGPEPSAGVIKPEDGAQPPPVTGLHATNIYGADGTLFKQIGFQSQATVVPWIALVNADGSMDVTHYSPNLQVVRKEHVLADGTVTAVESRFRRPERMEPFDQKYRDNYPVAADPTADFNKLEDRAWLFESMRKAMQVAR